jgi:uncharacterized protein
MRRVLLGFIRYYQRAVSPGLPAACKFQPSCSRYAYEAIDRFGALRGSVMAARRLLRCMPWSAGGFDPIPERPIPERAVPERKEKSPMQHELTSETAATDLAESRPAAGRTPV